MENKHTQELQDPDRDKAKLQPDETTMELPEVKDIPGQENIHPPDLREMADTTIASDDEEGAGVFETDAERLERAAPDENIPFSGSAEPTFEESPLPEENAPRDGDAITKEELEALEQTGSEEEENLRRARPDDKDAEGVPLNESTGNSGKDLDVPGEELDDETEEKGEEDEENNEYSLSDNKDQ